MEKTVVSKQIKPEILTICSGPTSKPENLNADMELSLPGYDEYDHWCRLFENHLQYIATNINTGKQMPVGNISAATTVNQCIQMVI